MLFPPIDLNVFRLQRCILEPFLYGVNTDLAPCLFPWYVKSHQSSKWRTIYSSSGYPGNSMVLTVLVPWVARSTTVLQYVKQLGSVFPWWRTYTTCVISFWSNDCKYQTDFFLFTQTNSVHNEFMCWHLTYYKHMGTQYWLDGN